MRYTKGKPYSAGLWGMGMLALAVLCRVGTVSAAEQQPENPVCHLPSDAIICDAMGNAHLYENGEAVTGWYRYSPDFAMGDLNQDTVVNAQDASVLLSCAANAGVTGKPMTECIAAECPALSDAGSAIRFADANEDGWIGADDAAAILCYAAEAGADAQTAPLGTHTYFADRNGTLQKGFFTDPESGKTFYADDTYALQSGRVRVDDAMYLLDADGAVYPEGWVTNGASRSYVQADGTLLCDAWREEDGKRFHFDAQGRQQTGVTVIDGETYCFNGDGLADGWFVQWAKRYYCVDGIPQTGTIALADGTYYFDPETFCMVTGWNESRYFAPDGKMQTGWAELDGGKYYFDADGIAAGGVTVIGEETYRFDPETHRMQTGWVDVEGSPRYFDETGRMATGWAEPDGVRHYFHEDGTPAAGLLTIDAVTYYFGDHGALYTGWMNIDGTMHYFGEAGMYRLWHEIDGHTYCFGGEDGVMLTGWADIGEYKYYFGEDGIMVTNQTVGDWYLTADGTAISNCLHINRQRAQEAFAKNGTSVDGIYHYVRSTTRYKKIEATKTLQQIESNGWLYYVDYSMTHYYGVCYYLAAKMDFLLREAGYECRMVHSTHGSGDHYWNQVNVNGNWENYDLTNGLYNKSWNQMIAYGNYVFLGYVVPEYR